MITLAGESNQITILLCTKGGFPKSSDLREFAKPEGIEHPVVLFLFEFGNVEDFDQYNDREI